MNEWLNEKVRRLKWFDISLVKLSTMFFTLFLVKIWAPLMTWDWEIYLALALLFSVRPFYRAYLDTSDIKKNNNTPIVADTWVRGEQ